MRVSAREAVAAVVNDLRDAHAHGDERVLRLTAERSADRLAMLLDRGVADPDGGTVTASVTLESEGREWVFSATGSTPEETEKLLRDATRRHGFEGVVA